MFRMSVLILGLACLPFGSVSMASEEASAAASDVWAEVALNQVPGVVMEAAKARMPDAYFQKAIWVLEDDVKVYRLSGGYFRKEVTVYVREDGKYLWSESNHRGDD